MPPRYTYWTILVDDLPTAFRSARREELRPTFERLRAKHPNAVMRWFARGRLWNSPEEAEAPPPREARGPSWRPGGRHEDPRERFKKTRDERRARWRDRHGPVRDDAPPGEEPRGERATSEARAPFGDRPPRVDRPREDRGARPRGDKPFGDRPPRVERPREDRGARPRGDKPFGDRPPRVERPREDRGARPRGDKPFGDRPPRFERPREDRGARPRGDGRAPSRGSRPEPLDRPLPRDPIVVPSPPPERGEAVKGPKGTKLIRPKRER